jgi:hypothetical protein
LTSRTARADGIAAAVELDHQPLALELEQRLTCRRPADTETGGNAGFEQAAVPSECAAPDLARQDLAGALIKARCRGGYMPEDR